MTSLLDVSCLLTSLVNVTSLVTSLLNVSCLRCFCMIVFFVLVFSSDGVLVGWRFLSAGGFSLMVLSLVRVCVC